MKKTLLLFSLLLVGCRDFVDFTPEQLKRVTDICQNNGSMISEVRVHGRSETHSARSAVAACSDGRVVVIDISIPQ